MLAAFISYFIDNNGKQLSVGNLYRARLLILSSFASALLLTPFTLTWGTLSHWRGIQFLLLIIALVTLFTTPFIFRYSKSIRFSGVYLNLNSTLIMMAFAYIDGGVYSTSIPWFPVLPLFGVFFSGKKYGVFICSLLIAFLALLLYLHSVDQIPTRTIDEQSYIYLYAGSTVSAVIVLLFVSFNYLSWQKAVHSELIKASQTRNDFLTGVSHELRTPLNSILGFSEVLSRRYVGELNKKQAEYVDNINSSGEHLLQLVNDLLDISKIEAGQMKLLSEKVELFSLCEQSITMIKGSAKTKNINLVTQIQNLEGTSLWLDALKIKQVLLNLLNNAVKYTPAGGAIIFSASMEDDKLVFSVEDNGPGIPNEHRSAIFDRFYQINTQTDNKQPGTGLGLAISKHYVEMHGGRIYLSNQELGAKFVCELPAMMRESPQTVNQTAFSPITDA